MKRVSTWLAIGLMVLAAAPYAAAQQHAVTSQNVNQKVMSAKTPADHEAIAAYYDNEAVENHKMAVYHSGMANIFTKAPHRLHCRELVKRYGDAVEADKAAAREHREMAVSAR